MPSAVFYGDGQVRIRGSHMLCMFWADGWANGEVRERLDMRAGLMGRERPWDGLASSGCS